MEVQEYKSKLKAMGEELDMQRSFTKEARQTGVINKLLNKKLYRALQTWRIAVSTKKMHRIAVRRSLKKWQNRTIATVFSTWKKNAHFEMQTRHKIKKFLLSAF